MWWNKSNMGGSTDAKMFIRMISSPCNLIKHYCYVVDHPSRALVMTMKMISIVENQYTFVEF